MDFLKEWEEKLAIKITCSQVCDLLFSPTKQRRAYGKSHSFLEPWRGKHKCSTCMLAGCVWSADAQEYRRA